MIEGDPIQLGGGWIKSSQPNTFFAPDGTMYRQNVYGAPVGGGVNVGGLTLYPAESLDAWGMQQTGSDIFDMAPGILAGGVLAGGLGGLFPGGESIFQSIAGQGGLFGSGTGTVTAGAGDAAWGINPRGDALYSGSLGDYGLGDWSMMPQGGGELYTLGSEMVPMPGFGSPTDSAIASSIGSFGGSGGLGAGTAQAGGSALSRLLNGSGTAADWASVLGTLGATGLGILGADRQADAYENVANQYLNLGAPYRNLLQASYAPGFSIWNDQATKDAAGAAADIAARSYSARVGNPFDNPTAQAGIYDTVLKSVALPQLNTYRSQLGSFGQLGVNTAGTSSLAGAGEAGGVYDALGYGLNQLTNPQPSVDELLRRLQSGGRFSSTGFY